MKPRCSGSTGNGLHPTGAGGVVEVLRATARLPAELAPPASLRGQGEDPGNGEDQLSSGRGEGKTTLAICSLVAGSTERPST